MADNTILPGTGEKIATDELTLLNGAAADAGLKAQRIKVGYGPDGSLQDVTPDAPLPVQDAHTGSLLSRILRVLLAPLGYDMSLQRYRQTAVVESGTVTTVTTVTTLTNLTNITGNIGTYQANQQVFGQNQASWAALVRARIT